MDIVKAPTAQGGWLEGVKDKINPDQWMAKLNLSKARLVDIGLYLGFGFVTGFLLKKYGRYVVVFGFMVLGLVALQQLGVLNVAINWNKAQELFGIQRVETPDTNLLRMYVEWIKLNVGLVLTFSIGFIAGLKVG